MKRTITLIAAISLTVGNLFAGSAAFAHDEVVSTSPEAGTTVEAGIVDLSVTFNEDVMISNGNDGFAIAVADSKGVAQPIGCLEPSGSTLSARVAINNPGEYSVSWHSVSNDGHPNEGTYKFTVTNTTGSSVAPDEVNNCPRLLIATPPTESTAIAYSATDAISNNNTPLEVIALIAVLAVILGAAVWVTRSRKKNKD